MKVVTVSGPPSVGKTSVILKVARVLIEKKMKVGAVKMDCLSAQDHQWYEKKGIPIKTGLSGSLCPDHFFVSNIEDCLEWGLSQGFDLMVSESAGLCNRCSPHILGVTAVCVIDNLMGIHTPFKIGPMLKSADMVVVTKGDVVSQAEREVFAFKIMQANPKCRIFHVNGITGQGIDPLTDAFIHSQDLTSLQGSQLRFSVPSALCSYCLGETRIGNQFQMGSIRKMDFGDRPS